MVVLSWNLRTRAMTGASTGRTSWRSRSRCAPLHQGYRGRSSARQGRSCAHTDPSHKLLRKFGQRKMAAEFETIFLEDQAFWSVHYPWGCRPHRAPHLPVLAHDHHRSREPDVRPGFPPRPRPVDDSERTADCTARIDSTSTSKIGCVNGTGRTQPPSVFSLPRRRLAFELSREPHI